MTTVWTSFPEQPELRNVPGHVRQNEGDGKHWHPCSPFEMTPPHQPGDRVPVLEEYLAHWGKELGAPFKSVRITARILQSNGTFAEATDENPLWLYYRSENPESPYAHLQWRKATADEVWAIRTYLTVLSCEPELCDGVWRWKTTYNEGDKS